jgi:type IV secretory pathway VirD2 relaxase
VGVWVPACQKVIVQLLAVKISNRHRALSLSTLENIPHKELENLKRNESEKKKLPQNPFFF